MKYRLLNFLICPRCKEYPLKLHIIEEKVFDRDVEIPPCDQYCGYKETMVAKLGSEPPCRECMKHEVIDGYLTCGKCGEWYPIIDMIVVMHLDKLRPKKPIEKFIEKHRDKLPNEIIEKWRAESEG
jgi:uncharacterized protein YbaR (Trm112 family)